MVAYHEVDAQRRIVTVKYDSVVRIDDICEYLAKLRADPVFDRTFSELVDLSDVTQCDITFDEASKIARVLDPFAPEARRAFVAPQLSIFGLVRMYQGIRMDDGNMYVCRTLEEAKAWLACGE